MTIKSCLLTLLVMLIVLYCLAQIAGTSPVNVIQYNKDNPVHGDHFNDFQIIKEPAPIRCTGVTLSYWKRKCNE